MATPCCFSAIVIDFTEETEGVRIRVLGSVDVTGLTQNGTSNFDVSSVVTGVSTLSLIAGINGATEPVSLYEGATSNIQIFTTNSGFRNPSLDPLPNISIFEDFLLIPGEYSNPSTPPAQIVTVLAGETFASLSLLDGVVSSARWSTDSISFRTGSAVPEPSTLFTLCILSGLAAVRRRR